MNAVLVVRTRSGVVRESARVCHLVAVPDGRRMPDCLVAYCGARLSPGEAELMDLGTGMPCEVCLARRGEVAALPQTISPEAGDVAMVLERLAQTMATVAEDIRHGLLSPERIARYGDLVHEVAELLWSRWPERSSRLVDGG